ncbi:MAG: TRAP transporter substrate-binding protein [Pseudomonadota bacterium]
MKKKGMISWIGTVGSVFILTLLFAVQLRPASAASEAKPIELSFGNHAPPKSSPNRVAFASWIKKIEKRTNGRLKIKIYPSQILFKARDAYDGVVNGIADISWGAFSFTPGRFPLNSVMELPFLSPSPFVGSHALHDLHKIFPEMRAELKDVHLLDLWVSLPYEIHTVKKPIRAIDDMKGMKFVTQPGARAAVEGLGAIPVTMPNTNLYQALEKGVADGVVIAYGSFKSFKLYELTKYHTNAHLAGLPHWLAMNKNTWNRLPKDLQRVLAEVTAEMFPDALTRAVSDEMDEAIEIIKKLGHETIDLPSGELAKWKATGKPAWGKWVKDMEAKGLPGQKVLDEALRLVEKYSK